LSGKREKHCRQKITVEIHGNFLGKANDYRPLC